MVLKSWVGDAAHPCFLGDNHEVDLGVTEERAADHGALKIFVTDQLQHAFAPTPFCEQATFRASRAEDTRLHTFCAVPRTPPRFEAGRHPPRPDGAGSTRSPRKRRPGRATRKSPEKSVPAM